MLIIIADHIALSQSQTFGQTYIHISSPPPLGHPKTFFLPLWTAKIFSVGGMDLFWNDPINLYC
jgi:hypothetical protein